MRKKTPQISDEQIEQNVPQTQAEAFVEVVDDVNVGSILKKAREKKKKEIKAIADVLCIRSCYLQALEESDYESFPAKAYAIGFLRNYADFLGLDVDALIEQYRKETNHLKSENLDMPIVERANLFPSAKYVFISIFVIILIWAFWYFISYSEDDIQIPETQVAVVEDIVQKETVLPVPEQVVETKLEPVVKKENTIEKKSEPKVKKEPAGLVQIFAKEDAWVEIDEDGTLILSRVLKKGETYTVPKSETELFLKTGNAGGTEILIDGQKIKSLGPSGAVRSGISLSVEKLKNR